MRKEIRVQIAVGTLIAGIGMVFAEPIFGVVLLALGAVWTILEYTLGIKREDDTNMRNKKSLLSQAQANIQNVYIGGVDENSGFNKGIVIEGTAFISNGFISARDTAIEVKNAPGLTIKETIVSGNGGAGSVGYDIEDSTNTNLENTESIGFETGYRIRNSPNSTLGGSKATASTKRHYQVKLPEEMLKQRENEKRKK